MFSCNVCPAWNGNSKYIPKCLAKHLNGLHQPLWKISHFRLGGICGVKCWTMKGILPHCEARGIQWQLRAWIVNQACHPVVVYKKPYSLYALLGFVIRILCCFPKTWSKIRLMRHLFSVSIESELWKRGTKK